MRLAVISDIHGNLPAVEAVLADIAARDVDAVCHLGDLVGYGPWPNEVVERIRDEGIAGVAGNYDTTVAHGHANCGCQYDDPRQRAREGDSVFVGHTHTPWTRSFRGTILVNTGSVGRPRDGDPRASYALAEAGAAAIEVVFPRVDYDVERAVAAIADAGLPTALGRILRSGGRL